MQHGQLIQELNQAYNIPVEHIELHRDLIGKVYFVQTTDHKYVFKIYRSFKSEDALQSVRILDYLKANSYPAASVVRTARNDSHTVLSGVDGCCTGILYDYIEGTDPDGKLEADHIGRQIGELHNLMENYPGKLIHRTQTDYIVDYLSMMREMGFAPAKILELQQYGHELWGRITRLPMSFCHGDLHTGNMIRNQSGEYVLFDFDDASGDYPGMDVAYMSDDTHFNQFHESMYDQTAALFERFYSGYSQVRTLDSREMDAVFDFIAVRHYQIVSRIVRCQGLQSISLEFCAEQHEWLMRWRELCRKKQ